MRPLVNAAAVGVLVFERAVDDVGHGLEAAVRMPRRAFGLPRRVFDLAHLVEVDERVQVREVDPRESASYRESLPLEPVRGGRDRPHAALPGLRPKRRDAVECRDVVNGDCCHDELKIVDSSSIPFTRG